MKEPTQEDFEAWRHSETTIKKWRLPNGGLVSSEAELAWVYLCESLGSDFTDYRCCAKRRVEGAEWDGHPCEYDREKCWKQSAKATMEGMEVLRQIDALVKDFVANKNRFQNQPVRQDRIEMVLEDLQ